jgi:sugar transferase (PEP-CTERM/EpsH1 system associated)
MNILFLSPTFPLPVTRGDKLRIFNQIKYLSLRHKITLLSFISRNEMQYVDEMNKYCSHIKLVKYGIILPKLNMLMNVFSFKTSLIGLFQSYAMERELSALLKKEKFDVLHVSTIKMVPYVLKYSNIPKLLDMIDSYSLNMKNRLKTDLLFKKPFIFWEFLKAAFNEKKILTIFKYIVVCSERDRARLLCPDKTFLIPNGVDTDYFYYSKLENRNYNLVFVGNMGYYPNCDAVFNFVHNILPKIKEKIPEVRFYIVGANPTRRIKKLSKIDNNIFVTGEVKDVRPYLLEASVFVSPIRAGSGMQNKILQSMAMGIPVVSTSFSASGIEYANGINLFIADDPEGFSDKTIKLLKNVKERGIVSQNARELVEAKYSWVKAVNELEKLYSRLLGGIA